MGRANYDNPIGDSIQATDPFFSAKQLKKISANALGLAYNARVVLPQMDQWIQTFKTGKNPVNMPAAAVQADVVGHSMGGLVARALVLQPTFLSNDTFGQGSIHKVITVDTPHLGSPVAIQLLSSAEHNGCLQNLLADNGKFPVALASLSGGLTYSGAVTDLQGDDTTGFLSSTLTALDATAPHPLPTALIAGIYQNFASLDSLSNQAFWIRHWYCPNDSLAQQLTSTGWPAIFHGNANDAMVSEVSQLAGLDPSVGFPYFGYVHSPGTEQLGFSSPSVMDTGDIPAEVIFLLNKPWPTPEFYVQVAP